MLVQEPYGLGNATRAITTSKHWMAIRDQLQDSVKLINTQAGVSLESICSRRVCVADNPNDLSPDIAKAVEPGNDHDDNSDLLNLVDALNLEIDLEYDNDLTDLLEDETIEVESNFVFDDDYDDYPDPDYNHDTF